MKNKPKGIYLLNEAAFNKIYGPEERADINAVVDISETVVTPESLKENPSVLEDVEIIFSGWGAPLMDAEFLALAPKLEAVFYGAGTIRHMVTEAFWERGIVVTSSYAANAVPVAEFCVSQILFSLKLGWRHVLNLKATGEWRQCANVPGAYGSRVGLISLGMIGRKTLELLKPYDLKISVFSTSLNAEDARRMGVSLYSLDEIFAECDVVSLHTPNIPATRGMIQGSHFKRMKTDATFINTARGAVVNEPEMIEVLKERADITALLDVTNPEPPEKNSPLYTLPNVVLTPHIAGSLSGECRRMGRYAVEECRRYLSGAPLQWQITREIAARLA